ncbi:hypothetical protein PBT90_03595 [Algoriphagus halophytocola]|uniref:Capsule assembly Wzi family protein n=1 Tax=Algoriphagus halophytocola TaxID=2991499 RepID=A0ABY6MHK6_9BACT|nr:MULTISPECIES: hypothetical protein [unclassified Algoriphagus]UZD22510.1 hypothetical protein OM944_17865 [Algoriphagus sp. TR-M5]WBL43772.1 hypothetical protein PBT90_03595 [Algoriphagus sp. TR-M9]
MRNFFLGLLVVLPFLSFSQQEKKQVTFTPDMHLRVYWMSTSYPGEYKDDYALGTSFLLGGKVSFKEQWQVRAGFRTYANLSSSDLSALDPVSNGSNRYEVGLFDLLDKEDRFFGKLESISLSYTADNWGFSLGRMGVHSDWVNSQDGRLSPTGIEGGNIWYETKSDWRLSAWGIGKMSVRGTSEWLSVGESIGVFPGARDVNGQPSQYPGNTASDWIGILEVSKKWGEVKLNMSNTLVQNISNTLWLQTEKSWKNSEATTIWLWGIQAGFQSGLGEGGNPDFNLQYKNPKDRNWVFSTRVGYEVPHWNFHLNYTKVGGQGRWLSPREWGKDAWYTFIPRERNEGNSSVDALTAFAAYSLLQDRLKFFAHLGIHWLPALDSPEANKYNMPSYRQLNLGVKYQPAMINKLDFQLLVMNKEALGDKVLNPRQIYNKVQLIHVNLIANWRWN